MIEAAWQRAMLLYQQQRWDLAERELRGLLAQDPEFAPAYAMLGIILTQTNRLDDALLESRQAIKVDPESDFGFHALATVYMARRDLNEAVAATTAAIELAPEDSSHRGLLAQVRFRQERWDDALQAADAGLAIDPQDTDCLNLRSLALTKLGRSEEATASVAASLAHDPENPYTHQTSGFAELHKGDPQKALTHFQEALRRDPTLDGARQGLVEALKARNPIYRMVLGWFLWLDRFAPNRRFQIIIGIYIGAQVLRRSLRAAGYESAATVVGYSWVGFVLLTACAVPLFNLLLLLHPIGRHALERSARNHALLLGTCLAITIAMFVGSVYSDHFWLDGIFWLIFLLPIAGLGLFLNGWAKHVMQAICVGLLGAWLWWAFGAADVTAQIAALKGARMTPENEALATQVKASAESLGSLHGNIIMAAALSTWFALLAPKGHQNRRR